MYVGLLWTRQCEHQLFQTLLAFAIDLGFDYCAYGLRAQLPLSEPKTVMFNNYPQAWQSQYQTRDYLTVDLTVQHGLNSALPILWSDELFGSARELWEEARSFGLRYGWAQSARDFSGAVGMLTLARSAEPISQSELSDKFFRMVWLSQMAHTAISHRLMPKLIPEMKAKLSNREIAVLRWTADGKTACEISEIMNITRADRKFSYQKCRREVKCRQQNLGGS